MPTIFAKRLANIARQQFDQFHEINEADPELFNAIVKWGKDVKHPINPIKEPWSAIFVSWCVFAAGAAKEEFEFSKAHAVFVNTAIKNGLSGTGVFRAFDVGGVRPQVGDIIQNNREGKKLDFEFARKNRSYKSHSAIVVEVTEGGTGKFARVIGGNEHDSVRINRIDLTADGFVKQRKENPFICVVQTLKK